MWNYKNLEYEFIERTLALIKQYKDVYPKFLFEEQYNHTLLINCGEHAKPIMSMTVQTGH